MLEGALGAWLGGDVGAAEGEPLGTIEGADEGEGGRRQGRQGQGPLALQEDGEEGGVLPALPMEHGHLVAGEPVPGSVCGRLQYILLPRH